MAQRSQRWYISLDALKDELGITDYTSDAKLKRAIERASRFIEVATGRTFIPVTATKYFDYQGSGKLFLFDADLLSITTLTDGDGSISATDYWLYPLNDPPYHSIVMETDTRYFEYDDEPNKAITIVGSWGWCNDYDQVGTLAAAITSTSATTFAVTMTEDIEIGWCLLVDSEQMFVKAVDGNVVTVQRGNSGTTAATHLINAAVYRYVPPADVEMATAQLAGYYYGPSAAGSAGITSMSIGEYSVSYGGEMVPQGVAEVLKRYTRVAG